MLLTLLVLACRPSTEPDDTDKPTIEVGEDDTAETEKARWTFMVFMNGDNDLETYVTHDLNELEQVGSSDGVNVLVQADRSPGYLEDDGDWEGTRRYLINGDDDLETVSSPVLEDMGELDMGDPQVLADFMLWANESYPAEHVALVMWDHGDGWAATATKPPGAISWDESSGSDISIAGGEFGPALQQLVDARGAPIDVLAFDACNMAYWEMTHAMSDYADFLVASEATVGDEGLQYGPAMALLADDAQAGGYELAVNLAEQAVSTGGEWTYSASDLSAYAPLSAAIDQLAGLLLDREDGLDVFEELRGESRSVERAYPYWYMDLIDFATVVAASDDPDLAAAGQDILDAIPAVMISNNTSGPLTWAGGLTIHTDTDPTWDDYLEVYANGPGATWAEDTRWDDLILAGAGML